VGQMSASKLAAGFCALAIGAAVVTAFAASPELKPAAAPAEANAAPAAKSDRLAIRRAKPEPRPVTSAWACPQEPWPYGCQWRSPTRKVLRPSRPS
jgi:hypothetical protein